MLKSEELSQTKNIFLFDLLLNLEKDFLNVLLIYISTPGGLYLSTGL